MASRWKSIVDVAESVKVVSGDGIVCTPRADVNIYACEPQVEEGISPRVDTMKVRIIGSKGY